MAQYHSGNDEYVDRNNELFDVVILGDEDGGITSNRYNKDAWNRSKSIMDFSLFSATWTYGVPNRVWEENNVDGTDINSPIFSPQSTFTKVTSVEHMLSVKSGTVVDAGYAVRSKRYPKYQPNRGHLFSTALILPNAIGQGVRSFGLSSNSDGVYFQLEGNGISWDLFVVRQTDNIVQNKVSIKKLLPADFDPSKGHVYDIQYQWRGVGNYFFFVDLKMIYEFDLLGTLTALSIHDPALPVTYCSICKEAGTELEVLSGCVDVTSEGGTIDKTLFGTIDTGSTLITLSSANVDTATVALRVPRYVTYNGSSHHNSRGCTMDKLVTWTRDESLTKAFLFRDLNATNINGLTWSNIDDSNLQYLVGGNTSPLQTAFLTDKAGGKVIVNEWADLDYKNIISNPAKNADFYLTPGDILVITVAAITTNVKSSSSLYFSEEI